MKKLYIMLWLTLLCLFSGGFSFADDITADVLTYDGKTQVVTAKGEVVIHGSEGAILRGDEAEYYVQSRTSRLWGNVVYEKDSIHATASEIHISSDKTLRGMGGVSIEDTMHHHVLRGDDITYQFDTGFGKIEGNGYYESREGYIEAPYIEGYVREIRMEARGGVTFYAKEKGARGRADRVTYTRSGSAGTDGTWILSGHAHVTQNGNVFDGPELIIRDEDKIVETQGRSTLVIDTDKSSV